MEIELKRTYHFEAAHYLPMVARDHKCSRLHGHSYTVDVFIRGAVGANGMVVDFAEVDRIVRPIIRTLDHSLLNDVINNPTVENLCFLMRDKLTELKDLCAIVVSETKNSSAMIRIK